jgi:hypothetical protein
MGSRENLKEYIEEATTNIRNDRAMTTALLIDIMHIMKKSEENQKNLGFVAAKYMETLQRSNEQLVKLANLLQRRDNKSETLTAEDKEEIFEIISGAG